MSNQMIITCPIFNVDTKVAHCVELRHRIFRGEAGQVRRGCQACVASGKCPIAREVTKTIHHKLSFQDYVSDEPKKGKLSKQMLTEIRPVVVQSQHLDKYGVSPEERDLIMTANPRIDAQLGHAPSRENKPLVERNKREVSGARTRLPPSPKVELEANKVRKTETAADHAAATGDMSAALNQAA